MIKQPALIIVLPVMTGCIQQVYGSNNVGMNKLGRIGYGPVDMRFGSKMDYPVDVMIVKNLLYGVGVIDICLYEGIV
jgi:hypothetical protein